MNLSPAKAIAYILKRHGIPVCIVGELALNYYNVPRVLHDVEFCVPEDSLMMAPGILYSTGLFEQSKCADEYNNYTEYKRGFPRLQTTPWTHPRQTFVIFSAAFFGLEHFESVLAPSITDQRLHISKELAELTREDLINLPLPRLAPFVLGLAKRFLDTSDDMAMVATEQLVDGMNLDEAWIDEFLEDAGEAAVDLITRLVRTKKLRVDYFSENKVTCFINDEDEAANIRLIPGFS